MNARSPKNWLNISLKIFKPSTKHANRKLMIHELWSKVLKKTQPLQKTGLKCNFYSARQHNKHSHPTIGIESMHAIKQKNILTCFLKKSQFKNFQEKTQPTNSWKREMNALFFFNIFQHLHFKKKKALNSFRSVEKFMMNSFFVKINPIWENWINR